MSVISIILAGIQTRDLSVDAFLDRLVVIERWFYHASWWFWWLVLGVIVAVLVISVVSWIRSRRRRRRYRGFDLKDLGCFGCVGIAVLVFLLILPATSWATWQFAVGAADAYGPSGPLSDAFWLNAALFVLFIFSGG